MPSPPNAVHPAASLIRAPFTFSQSSLQDYSDCPRRFELRYINELSWPAVEVEPLYEAETRQRDALQFHRMVQQFLLGVPEEAITALAQSAELSRWWNNFLSHPPNLNGETLFTEKSLSARVGQHRLVSKYDCIAVDDGRALILDWKTYARRPTEAQLMARWQTRIYRAMLVLSGQELNGGARFEPAAVSMIYWFAEFPSEPIRISYDEHQFDQDAAAIEALIDEISRARRFPLTADHSQCRFCAYRSLCERGQAAGDWRDSEAATPSGDDFDLKFEQIGEIEF